MEMRTTLCYNAPRSRSPHPNFTIKRQCSATNVSHVPPVPYAPDAYKRRIGTFKTCPNNRIRATPKLSKSNAYRIDLYA